MIRIDESALICDLAETYHIYDYRSHPARRIATFSVGLRAHSRIKLLVSGSKYPLDTLLLARLVDAMNINVWLKTKDAKDGKNRPESILDLLINDVKEPEHMIFESIEAYEEFMEQKRKGWNDQ